MKKEYLYAGSAILLWSTAATVSKMMMSALNNVQLLWISSFFAGTFLLIVNLCSGRLKEMKKYSLKDIFTMILIGLPGVFVYYMCYYAGADRMPASQAFIINYMWPICGVIFSCILLREKMTARKIIAICVSFAGLLLVMGKDLLSFGADMILGALFCLTAAVSYGFFTAINKKMRYDKWISMMLNYQTAFVLATVINMVNGDLFVPNATQIAGTAWNGCLSMALACTLWAVALDMGQTEKISNLAYITPFLSLIWISLILKEEFKIMNLVGMAVIVGGILIQFGDNKRKKEKAMNLKAAVFDMDGTLINSLIFWNELWEALGTKYRNDPGFKPTEEDDKTFRTATLNQTMAIVHDHYHMGESAQELIDIANDSIVELYSQRVLLKPGVREFLDDCQAKGVKMIIASATERRYLEMAMEHCDLNRYFPEILSCGDIGKGKDQPDIYLMACEHLGTKPEETWVFEDSAVAIETATKIGMPTVAIYDPFNYGQDKMQKMATHYIAEGESLMKLI